MNTKLIGFLVYGIVLWLLGFYLAWHHQSTKIEKIQGEYSTFVANTKAQGEAAQAATKLTEQANQTKKEKADYEYKNAIATLAADNKRLRNTRARSSFVPTATTSSQSPGTACFDRDQLESAIRNFDAGVQGIVDQGDQSRVGLDVAKEWAKETQR